MNNPFEAPGTRLATEQQPAQRRQRVVLAACLFIASGFAVLMMLLVSQFDQMLSAFGSDLPLLTWLLVKGHLLAWALPGCVLASRFLWPNPSQRERLMIGFGIVGPLAMFPFAIFALYLPIFQLAATV